MSGFTQAQMPVATVLAGNPAASNADIINTLGRNQSSSFKLVLSQVRKEMGITAKKVQAPGMRRTNGMEIDCLRFNRVVGENNLSSKATTLAAGGDRLYIFRVEGCSRLFSKGVLLPLTTKNNTPLRLDQEKAGQEDLWCSDVDKVAARYAPLEDPSDSHIDAGKAKAIAKWGQRIPPPQIAKELNLTVDTVLEIIRKERVRRNKPGWEAATNESAPTQSAEENPRYSVQRINHPEATFQLACQLFAEDLPKAKPTKIRVGAGQRRAVGGLDWPRSLAALRTVMQEELGDLTPSPSWISKARKKWMRGARYDTSPRQGLSRREERGVLGREPDDRVDPTPEPREINMPGHRPTIDDLTADIQSLEAQVETLREAIESHKDLTAASLKALKNGTNNQLATLWKNVVNLNLPELAVREVKRAAAAVADHEIEDDINSLGEKLDLAINQSNRLLAELKGTSDSAPLQVAKMLKELAGDSTDARMTAMKLIAKLFSVATND
jgi:hypothetical protein